MVDLNKIAFVNVVVGIIQKEGAILIARRPEGKPYSGYWEFPGGKIEADETPRQALVRELQEELGIEVITCSPWLKHTHSYPDKTVNLHIWRIEAYRGLPTGQEGQLLHWTTCSELMKARIPLLEGNRNLINKLGLLEI